MTTTLPLLLKELLRRIETKTVKTASCWLWTGSVCTGAPVLWVQHEGKSRRLSVRRVLWLSRYGPVPKAHQIAPRCRVERCVFWEHFKSVFCAEVAWKGRRPRTCFQPTIAREVVREAVRLYRDGLTAKAIAARLGLKERTVHLYTLGRTRRRDSGMARLPKNYWKVRGRSARLGGTKLTWQELLVVRGLYVAGFSVERIAANFGVSSGHVWSLLKYGRKDVPLPPVTPRQARLIEAANAPHPDEALVRQHWKGGQRA
jgi:hypothetical protein